MDAKERARAVNKLRLRLLQGKGWRYLRYLHLRETVAPIAGEIETVCVCGAGRGIAELALAAEFPHLRVTLTDIIAPGYPAYHAAMDIAWKWGIENVSFSVWNVLEPALRKFDLIASTEMLEHIEDAPRAAENMRRAASKYLYCLVPFADDETNADKEKRASAWERHQHYLVGYDAKALEAMFGAGKLTYGAYWADHGMALRARLEGMETASIVETAPDLYKAAKEDVRWFTPQRSAEAQGIKTLVAV